MSSDTFERPGDQSPQMYTYMMRCSNLSTVFSLHHIHLLATYIWFFLFRLTGACWGLYRVFFPIAFKTERAKKEKKSSISSLAYPRTQMWMKMSSASAACHHNETYMQMLLQQWATAGAVKVFTGIKDAAPVQKCKFPAAHQVKQVLSALIMASVTWSYMWLFLFEMEWKRF